MIKASGLEDKNAYHSVNESCISIQPHIGKTLLQQRQGRGGNDAYCKPQHNNNFINCLQN